MEGADRRPRYFAAVGLRGGRRLPHMPQRLLIVEPDPTYASQLTRESARAGWVAHAHRAFPDARGELSRQAFDAVVGNIRLGGFNGVHLAYMVKQRRAQTAVILYAATHDPVLVLEAKNAGAFYELMEFLPHALRGYLTSALPPRDRRSAELMNRWQHFEGGRRASDVAVVRMAVPPARSAFDATL